jgi:hypothetical protein
LNRQHLSQSTYNKSAEIIVKQLRVIYEHNYRNRIGRDLRGIVNLCPAGPTLARALSLYHFKRLIQLVRWYPGRRLLKNLSRQV